VVARHHDHDHIALPQAIAMAREDVLLRAIPASAGFIAPARPPKLTAEAASS
jgi:hypothetical protein